MGLYLGVIGGRFFERVFVFGIGIFFGRRCGKLVFWWGGYYLGGVFFGSMGKFECLCYKVKCNYVIFMFEKRKVVCFVENRYGIGN